MESELLKRITTDSTILCGKPVIRRLRVSVDQVLNALAGGVTAEELLTDIPVLERADIQACLLYAAQVVEEHTHFVMAA